MGHTISNMTLNYEELNSGYNDLGFFSKNYGKIYDLNVECDIDAKVVGNGNMLFVGAISGFSSGDIQNCKASGTIDISSNNDGGVRIGGLVGQCNDGVFLNCSNETIINTNQTSQTCCGGIVGWIDSVVNIEKCFNSGKITINSTSGKIGGIIGYSGAKGMLKNSYNIGSLSAENVEDLQIGGIAGHPYSGGNEINFTIKNVYNNATISITKNSESHSDVGGIVGFGRKTLSIENALGIGNIEINDSNNSNIGGIIGQNEGIINNVYNSININNSESGNIVGFNTLEGNITNAYYNITGRAYYMNQGKIDSETVMYKEELPTILNVINSDNAFKEGEDENPIFNE